MRLLSLLAVGTLLLGTAAQAQHATDLPAGSPTSIVFADQPSFAPCGSETVAEAGLTSFFRNYQSTGVFVGQSFTAPCDGALNSLTITIYSLATDPAPASGTFNLTMVNGAGGTGSVVTTQEFTLNGPAATNSPTPVTLTLTSPFAVTQGQVYTLFYVQTAGGFQIIATSAPSYAGGELYLTGTGNIADATPFVSTTGQRFDQTFNLTFRAAVATEAGPEGARVSLENSVPNPAISQARVPFTLETASDVKVSVYDVLGREAAVIAEGPYAAGAHSADLNTSDLAPGTYVVRLVANGTVVSRTMTVAR